VALDSAPAIGSGGQSKLDDCVGRLTAGQQPGEFVNPSFQKMFRLENGVIEFYVVGLGVTAISVAQQCAGDPAIHERAGGRLGQQPQPLSSFCSWGQLVRVEFGKIVLGAPGDADEFAADADH
jgi:hypothetical protein